MINNIDTWGKCKLIEVRTQTNTCDICGATLKYTYIIEDQTGCKHMTGCECIKKALANGLVIEKAIKQIVRKAKQEFEKPYRIEELYYRQAEFKDNYYAKYFKVIKEAIKIINVNPFTVYNSIKKDNKEFSWNKLPEQIQEQEREYISSKINQYIASLKQD